jgi:hypothetical protein
MGGFVLKHLDNLKKIENAQKVPLFPIVPKYWNNGEEFSNFEFPEISKKEIEDRSKGDALAKGLIVCQLLWFISQIIARAAKQFEVTELELVTAAYALVTLTIYVAWWQKPLNVSCYMPVKMADETQADSIVGQFRHELSLTPDQNKSAWPIFFLGDRMTLFDSPKVPMLYTGPSQHFDTERGLTNPNLHIEFILGMLFGVIHCLAWNFTFNSLVERWAWRVSSVITVAYPAFFALMIFPIVLVTRKTLSEVSLLITKIIVAVSLVTGLYLYLVARLFLLILPLIALRNLPEGAYCAVSWAGTIPHIG